MRTNVKMVGLLAGLSTLAVTAALCVASITATATSAEDSRRDKTGTSAVRKTNKAPQGPYSKGLAEPRYCEAERVGFEPTVP